MGASLLALAKSIYYKIKWIVSSCCQLKTVSLTLIVNKFFRLNSEKLRSFCNWLCGSRELVKIFS